MDEIILNLHIEPLEEGGYLATSDDLPGLIAQGRTIAETVEIAQDVARKLIESYVEHGDPLPLGIIRSMHQFPQAGVSVQVPVGILAREKN